ncbi:MAG: hypothetical protein R3324_01630 [Halobacteriales archaeon]|nr:hypothetical protein [Halobacteriales archaeon]
MRVRDWQDLVTDVVEGDANPDGWRAIAGTRERGVGEDLFLGHPDAGLYFLKTYAKNPFEVRGVGAQVARKIDDELTSPLPKRGDGRFAVRQPPADEEDAKQKARRLEETVKAHADAPTSPVHLFDDLMEALESPAYGPVQYEMSSRPSGLDELTHTFEDAQEALETEFEDIIEDDGVNRGVF